MRHPDPNGPADLTPIQVGEVWKNPVTRERSTILELPWKNSEGRVTAELTALAGARVMGEHCHPALVERFTVLEGELTVKRDGQTSALREGETAVIEVGVWHDWWNATDRDARVRIEVTPGERFAHMIETLFGLARLGHTNSRGMPHLLQLALVAREFSDIIVFRRPPPARCGKPLSARGGRQLSLERVDVSQIKRGGYRSGLGDPPSRRRFSAQAWRRRGKTMKRLVSSFAQLGVGAALARHGYRQRINRSCGTVGGWSLDATDRRVVVSRNNHNLFTVGVAG
jgi:quercetin dioxygenase-like cupin family protein